MTQSPTIEHFSDLDLPDAVLRAVQAVGYEIPTPIQQRTIPPLMQGHDLLGHAPTGTGKTAAFALPMLSRIKVDASGVQALVLTPTRELAIQVSEAITRYAQHMKGIRVLPVYGGQNYSGQIRQLNRGVNVIVGTPGRLMDHMRRGALSLSNLQILVLDEADEMLRMGFIDDVEWILEQTPKSRQMALFSATMPNAIRRIANQHLRKPVEVTIEGRLTTAATIRQRYWLVSGLHKLDALTRILEAEAFDAMLVFVRTRTATVELAEKLTARGFAAAAMNGDMPQKQREQMVDKLKRGQLDILVATDVVARGLDVKRISHVINYDIPYDTEAYVHRIGRTGRAGRTGDAILFVTQRERRLLGSIEKATRQKIEALILPTIEMVNNRRIADFKQRIYDTLATGELAYLQRLVEEFSRDHDVPAERVSAALAKMCIGDQPLLLNQKLESAGRGQRKRGDKHKDQPREPVTSHKAGKSKLNSTSNTHTPSTARHVKPMSATNTVQRQVATLAADHNSTPNHHTQSAAGTKKDKPATAEKPVRNMEKSPTQEISDQRSYNTNIEMERFRVEVGRMHGVKPDNLVGAIANEVDLDAEFIGRITINDNHSLVELPAGMPKFLFKDLKRLWVCEQRLNISRLGGAEKKSGTKAGKPAGGTPAKRKSKTAGSKSRSSDPATAASELNAAPAKAKAKAKAKANDERPDRRKKERHRDRKNKGKRKKTALASKSRPAP